MAKKTEFNECWERLSQVIEETGLSVHSFAMSVGLNRSETMYQIRRGQIGISRNVAEMVTNRYPEYSKIWLMTGCGPKYTNPAIIHTHIPFYNGDLSSIDKINVVAPEYYLFLPMAGHVDIAITYHGDDMLPSIPNGTVLLLRRIEPDAIVFGKEYVVCTKTFTALRRIRCTDEEDVFRLEAGDPNLYDTITVNSSQITHIFMVRALITLKN